MITPDTRKELTTLLNERRVEAAVRRARTAGLSADDSDTLEELFRQYDTAERDFLESLISAEERSRLQGRSIKGMRRLFQGRNTVSPGKGRGAPLLWLLPVLLAAAALGWWWSRPAAPVPPAKYNVNTITTHGDDSDVHLGDRVNQELSSQHEKDTLRR